MVVTQQAFIAQVMRLHSTQLRILQGYEKDETSSFIKKHRVMIRDVEVFLDYTQSDTIQQRIEQARTRSEKLRTEAADVNTVMPMFLEQEKQRYAVVMVLCHRFVNKQWVEHLDVYYPDGKVQGLLFDQLKLWFKHNIIYTNSSPYVFHQPSPLAALFAMVSAITLDNTIKTAPNHYSLIYADQLRQILHKKYDPKQQFAVQSLLYHMIPHAGHTYGSQLSGVMQAWLNETSLTNQHWLLLAFLDKLLSHSMNLSADPKAAPGMYDQAQRFDVHQRKRYAISTVLLISSVAIMILASVGVMGTGVDMVTSVSAGTAAVGILATAYLWEHSAYRPPPLTCELRTLSTALCRGIK